MSLDVRPLRGLRFDPTRVDVGRVTCPPYDVISPAQQLAFHEQDPHNVIRVELALGGEGRYAQAAACLRQWQEEGVLRQDEAPSLYVYDQGFTAHGQEYTRRGVFCAVRLAPFGEGAVLPHERTLDKPKADRLALMRACRANVSPVFSMVPDPAGTVREALGRLAAGEPAVDFADEARVRHRLWTSADRGLARTLAAALRHDCAFIADGHHRYETCVAYRDERRTAEPRAGSDAAFEFTLMALVPMEDPGLVILPIHRLVSRLSSERLVGLADRLGEWFEVEDAGPPQTGLPGLLAEMRRRGAERHVFGAYAQDWPSLRLLTLKADPDRLLDPARSAAWRRLDVVLLHSLVIERGLGVDEASLRAEANVSYTEEAEEALAAVREGRQQVALFVNPTKLSDVRDVALAGDRMPQKCTFFYPKLRTGLVINPLEGRLEPVG